MTPSASRRAAAAVTAVLLVAACGGGPTGEGAELEGPLTVGEATEGSFDGQVFVYAGNGGDIQAYQMEIFDAFADIVGARTADDSPNSIARLQAQVDSGNLQWDFLSMDAVNTRKYCGELIEPIDLSLVDTSRLPEGIEADECGLPLTYFAQTVGYDADVFQGSETPETYEDFFDTERFPGNRALFGGEPQMALEMALLADGVAPEELYPLDVDRAFDKLDTIRDDLVFFDTGAEHQQIMDSGRATVAFAWPGRVYASNENGANWALSQTQPIGRINYYVFVKGSQNTALAISAVNYMLGAEQQAQYQEKSGYPSLNVDAEPDLDAAAQAVDFLRPPFEPVITVDTDYWLENIDELTDRWTTWKNR